MGRHRDDLTGRRIGRWTVEEFAGRSGSAALWRCRCDCGVTKVIRRDLLLESVKRSCDRCAKLAKPEYRAVTRMLTAGKSQADIARRLGKSKQRISQMVKFLAHANREYGDSGPLSC